MSGVTQARQARQRSVVTQYRRRAFSALRWSASEARQLYRDFPLGGPVFKCLGCHPHCPCSELFPCYCIDCDRLNFPACLDIDITGEVTAAVTVCPRADHHENWQKITTCIRKDVLLARGLFRIEPLFQKPILGQRFQPLGEHRWHDAKALPELVETSEPCMRVSEDENAPCIAYRIETPSNRALRN